MVIKYGRHICLHGGQANHSYFLLCLRYPSALFMRILSRQTLRQPENHNSLPLSAREEITSEKEWHRLQLRLQQLKLTHQELERVLVSFQEVRDEVEVKYQELAKFLIEES